MDLLQIILTSPLFLSIKDLLMGSILLAIFVSIILESIKNSIVNVFNIKDKKITIWIINIALSIILSVIYLYSMYFTTQTILMQISYIILLSLFNWGLSYLCYVFIIKWLIKLMDVIDNLIEKLKIKSEQNKLDEQLQLLKTKELISEVVKVKKIEEIKNEQNY